MNFRYEKHRKDFERINRHQLVRQPLDPSAEAAPLLTLHLWALFHLQGVSLVEQGGFANWLCVFYWAYLKWILVLYWAMGI